MHYQFLPHCSVFIKKWRSISILKRVVALVVLSLFLSILTTFLAILAILKHNFTLSYWLFTGSQPVPEVLSLLSFRQIPVVEVWRETIWLGKNGNVLLNKSFSSDYFISKVLEQDLLPTFEHTERLLDAWNKAVIRKVFWSKQTATLNEFRDLLKLARVFYQEQQTGKKYLVIFQNADEIRATGGFMGSYAVLDFKNSEFWRPTIRDIYDPSGISVITESPMGHARYLSDGRGMALHDANWFADFPVTAKKILWFFEEIKQDPQFYDGVIAINSQTVEKVLDKIGSIYLPSESRWMSAKEFSQVVRQDRNEFFPGSQQKAQQLQELETALWLKLEQLSEKEKTSLFSEVLSNQIWREVLVFSKNDQLQKTSEELEIAGEIAQVAPNDFFVYPLESNVGINKANAKVKRDLMVESIDSLLRLKVLFTNQAKIADRPLEQQENKAYKVANHFGYVNYYRFIVPEDIEVLSVVVGDEVLQDWESQEIAVSGRVFTEIGFLVVVPEESQKQVMIDFSAPDSWSGKILVQKQPGLVYQTAIMGKILPTIDLVGFSWSLPSREAVQ